MPTAHDPAGFLDATFGKHDYRTPQATAVTHPVEGGSPYLSLSLGLEVREVSARGPLLVASKTGPLTYWASCRWTSCAREKQTNLFLP